MAVKDLSDQAANSMWATSSHAGNRPSDPSVAMTAPGTPSPSVDETDDSPAGGGGDVSMQPYVQPRTHARRTVTAHGDVDWSPPGRPEWTTDRRR